LLLPDLLLVDDEPLSRLRSTTDLLEDELDPRENVDRRALLSPRLDEVLTDGRSDLDELLLRRPMKLLMRDDSDSRASVFAVGRDGVTVRGEDVAGRLHRRLSGWERSVLTLGTVGREACGSREDGRKIPRRAVGVDGRLVLLPPLLFSDGRVCGAEGRGDSLLSGRVKLLLGVGGRRSC